MEKLRNFYLNTVKKHPAAMILVSRQNSDRYFAFDDDAEAASLILGIFLRKSSDGYRYISFPAHALDIYLPRLIRYGHRVCICDDI